MGRYIFSRRDLHPLRGLIDSPLGRATLGATVPIKQTTTAPTHQETSEVSLPVPVQSQEQPEGVPLHEILSAVQTKVPSIKALAVRAGKLEISYEKSPTDEEREQVERALTTPQTFERVRIARPALLAAQPSADLLDILTNPATSDTDWLKAFRQYAVANLFPARSGTAGAPSAPSVTAATTKAKAKTTRSGNT